MTKTVEQYAANIIAMIREDVVNETVPATITDWGGLEGHVDANEYLIQAEVPWGTGEDGYVLDADIAFTRAVQDAVDALLAGGAVADLNTAAPDGACAVCECTFADVLEHGKADGWTFHYDRPGGVKIVAETCGAHADAYEAQRV